MIAKANTWDEGLTAKERSAIEYYTDPASECYNIWYEAYKKANYSQCNNWEANADRVRGKDRIKAAIRLIHEERAEKSEMSLERVQAMYLEDRQMAHDCKQPSAAISAVTGIARLYGMDKDNQQVKAEAPTELTEQQLKDLRELSAGLTSKEQTQPKLLQDKEIA